MNDISKDPFESLMLRRIEKVQLEGLPELEIREAPIRDIKPIMDQLSTMDPQELSYRLLGLSLYVDGEQLTYERVLRMTADMVKRLMPVMPAVFNVYGIQMVDSPQEAVAAETAEPPKDPSSPSVPEPSSNSPLPSTKRSAKSKGT